MAKPIYALVGSDSFLQVQKLSEILKLLPPDAARIEVDGEKADLADVLDELRSFAMFGGGKAVIVRDADAFITRFRSQLEDYAARPSDSGTLVLRLNSLPSNQRIAKAIAAVGHIEPCNPPKARDLPAWARERARTAHGIRLDAEAAAALCDLIGEDLGRLDNELAKLAIATDGGQVSAEQVGQSVAFQREREMWDMTNALAAGHPAEALKRWRQLVQLDSSAEFRAVMWLGMWLENVRRALAMRRKGMNAFAIANQLKIWPREAQAPFMETATAMGERGVARAIDLLARIDLQSKSGVGDAASNVERFILELAGTMQPR